jgi:hypothetical protein
MCLPAQQLAESDSSGRRSTGLGGAGGLAELDAQDDKGDAPNNGPDADDPDDADHAGAGPDEHQDAKQDRQCAADDAPDPSAVGNGPMSNR